MSEETKDLKGFTIALCHMSHPKCEKPHYRHFQVASSSELSWHWSLESLSSEVMFWITDSKWPVESLMGPCRKAKWGCTWNLQPESCTCWSNHAFMSPTGLPRPFEFMTLEVCDLIQREVLVLCCLAGFKGIIQKLQISTTLVDVSKHCQWLRSCVKKQIERKAGLKKVLNIR